MSIGWRCRGPLLIIAEEIDCFLDLFEVYLGIEAGAVRPFVPDAEDWYREGISQAAGEVSFTGYGYYSSRPCFSDYLSGNGPARSHKEIQMIGIGNRDEVTDFALSASFTIIYIMCKSYVALVPLKAMGKEEEYFFCPGRLVPDESVVQIDNGPLEQLLSAF